METLAERYTLLDLLLFKLVTMPEEETALLAIPEINANKVITLYHLSLIAGHQGIIKVYLTIGDIFFILGLIHHLRSYIKGCHICQLSGNELLQDFKLKRLAMINKDRIFFQCNSGDLVYIISPLTSQLRTSSRKVAIKYIVCYGTFTDHAH